VKILLVAVLVVLVGVIVWQVLSYEHTHIGFALLGAKARSAVPALIEIADRNISLEPRSHAVLSLGSIGPEAKEAVPALLRWGTSADQRLRLKATWSLGMIVPEPPKGVDTNLR
jgi:hypothetical protein